jgi:hypothetical protein
MPVGWLNKIKLNELTIVEFIVYLICGKRNFEIAVGVSALKLSWLKITCLIDLLKNEHILSAHKGGLKDKGASCRGGITEYLMSLISKNFIANSTWNHNLYSLFFYCSFMDNRKIYDILLRVYCAFVALLIKIACLRSSSLHFRNRLDYLSTFTLHSVLESILDVVFRSSSYTVMMLHHRQKLVRSDEKLSVSGLLFSPLA